MSILPRCVGIACLVFSFLLSGPVADAEKDGRIRSDAVRAWLAALREPVEQPQGEYPAGWASAYACLRKIGPDDRAVLPELITALYDSNSRVQVIAAEAIGNVGPEARDAVWDLRSLLRETGGPEAGDAEVACAVASALGQIGDEAIDAADDLVWAFRGVADGRAAEALQRMGPDVAPAVIHGLKDPNPNVRERCLALLPLLKCPHLLDWEAQLDLLGDQSESHHQCGCCGYTTRVGDAAAASLATFGIDIVPRLRKTLDNSNPFVRMRAASVLARLDVFDHSIATRLADAVRRDDTALEALRVIEGTKRGADPCLLSRLRALLKDSDPAVRSRVAVALTGFGAVDADVLRVHLQRLSDLPSADDAGDTLGRFEDQLKPLEPELAETAMRAAHSYTRWLATGLLARLSPGHPAVAVTLADIRKKIQSADELGRRCGLQAAFVMGEQGLPTVFELLKRGERIGYGRPPKSIEATVIAELLRAAPDPGNWNYVSRLIEITARNPSANILKPCVPILISHLQWRESSLEPGHEAAASCLVSCGQPAVPTLIRVLREQNTSEEIRSAIVPCLGKMGPAASEALPVLVALDFSNQGVLRWDVAKAIKEIGPSVKCLPFLLESLDDYLGSDDAQQAIVALGEPARLEVLNLLDSDNSVRRRIGVKLFLKLGGKPVASIPAILASLKRAKGHHVEQMQILASLGPAAKEATPLVAACLTSRYVRVRSAACITLARIAEPGRPLGDDVLASLLAATNDRFAEVRAAASDAIGLIGPQGRAARSAIERLCQDSFVTVRHAAERAAQPLNKHQSPPARIWTAYFDPSGPATGSSLAPCD
jgi:HEAT repeat protein